MTKSLAYRTSDDAEPDCGTETGRFQCQGKLSKIQYVNILLSRLGIPIPGGFFIQSHFSPVRRYTRERKEMLYRELAHLLGSFSLRFARRVEVFLLKTGNSRLDLRFLN
jgi:hypothetical protein